LLDPNRIEGSSYELFRGIPLLVEALVGRPGIETSLLSVHRIEMIKLNGEVHQERANYLSALSQQATPVVLRAYPGTKRYWHLFFSDQDARIPTKINPSFAEKASTFEAFGSCSASTLS